MGEFIGTVLREVVTPTAGAALLVVVFAFVREWAGQIKDERKQALILALVQEAEQLYGPGKGEAKRRYVREKAKQNGVDLARDEIETAVYGLTQTAAQTAQAATK